MKRKQLYHIFLVSNLLLGSILLLEFLFFCRCSGPNEATCPCSKQSPFIRFEREGNQFHSLNDRRNFTANKLEHEPDEGPLLYQTSREYNELNMGINDSTVRNVFQSRDIVKECNCKNIFDNNAIEIRRVRSVQKAKIQLPDEYIRETKNCDAFVSKRGYILDSLTKTEKDFPIAFSILMYKGVEQCERLLRAIYRPQNIYCIHVDNKTNESVYNAMESIASCFNNVFISPSRYDVIWGKISVLEADLHCMEELWNRSKTWKYFINLTGQEFPLKTNYELVEILKAYNGANDMESTRQRLDTHRLLEAGDPPHGIIPTKGSVHVIANRDFVEFVITDQRAKDFLEWCKKVLVPDEIFFSSLQHNPHLGIPGSYTGVPESFKAEDDTEKPFLARFKSWKDGFFQWPCHGKWVRKICVIGVGDLPLLSTRKELFVNKLHQSFQPMAYDCLEELIFNRTRDYYLGKRIFDVQWYKQLGFVKNKI